MIDDTSWILQGRILVVKYSGQVSYEEILEGTSRVVAMAKNGGLPPFVHLIGDSLDISSYTRGTAHIRPMMATFALLQRKPYLGWNVSVSKQDPAHAMSFIVTTAAAALGVRLHGTNTVKEALEFLCTKDRTLPRSIFEDIPC